MNRVYAVLGFGLLVRLLYAGWIAIQGSETGLELDAQGFFIRMVLIARTGQFEAMGVGEGIFLAAYGVVMTVFGDDVFVACMTSVLIWGIGAWAFARSLAVLKIGEGIATLACLLYTLWPTAIIYTAIPLRESAQLMFVNIALLGALNILVDRRFASWGWVLLGVTGAGWLHGGLTAFGGVFLVLVATMVPLMAGRKVSIGLFVLAIPVAVALGALGILISNTFGYDVSGGFLETVQGYQEGGIAVSGRTDYKAEAIGGGLFQALLGLPIGLAQYLFEPLPQRVGTIADILLFFENAMRFALITIAVIALRNTLYRRDRLAIAFLLLAYFAQEALWSLGTVNWGTASRHHVPAMGLLLAMGAFAWATVKERRAMRAKTNRRFASI